MSSRFDYLSTLADVNAVPHAQTKAQLGTKLDRAITNRAARLDDEAKLRVWAKAVKDRDRWIDRYTGQRVIGTRHLDPQRAEAHHIVSRDDRAVRYDVRNGVTLSLASHDAVERHRLRIVGTRWFVKDGVRYINANYPVRFFKESA